MRRPKHQRRRIGLTALLLGGWAVAVMLGSMPVWRLFMDAGVP